MAQPPTVTTPGQTSVVIAATRRLVPPFVPTGRRAEATDDPFPLDAFVTPPEIGRAAEHAPEQETAQPAQTAPEAAPEVPAGGVDVAAVADHLLRTIDGAAGALRVMTEADLAASEPGRWSRRQLLGHLIDSAANNHHRFVRAQRLDSFSFPKYDQEAWVALQHYDEADWEELVELWWLYNRHLGRVIRHIPADRLDVPCTLGGDDAVTLGFLVEDYVTHLEHHLRQLGVGG